MRAERPTLASLNYGLRFGPAICLLGALLGTLLASSSLFLLLALVAALGVFLPTPPLDWLYNVGVRHLLHAVPLPTTSRQRRFACLLATFCLLGAAGGFWVGQPLASYLFGVFAQNGDSGCRNLCFLEMCHSKRDSSCRL